MSHYAAVIADPALSRLLRISRYGGLCEHWLESATGVDVSAIRGCRTHCEVLSLRGCTHVGDMELQNAAALLPRLRSLDVRECKQVGDFGVRTVIERCTSLTALDLCGTCATLLQAGHVAYNMPGVPPSTSELLPHRAVPIHISAFSRFPPCNEPNGCTQGLR
jgi:hypothetical protein